MINWSGLESKYKKYLKSVGISNEGSENAKVIKTKAKVAKYLANEYEKAAKKGMEMYGNGVMKINKAPLEKAFKSAFSLMESGGPKSAAGMIMAGGFVACWTGGMMKMSVPPPTSTKVITNVVLFPGAPIPVSIGGPTDDAGALGGAIVKAAKAHAATVTGICTSLVPVPAAPPVPTPFPWAGIK